MKEEAERLKIDVHELIRSKQKKMPLCFAVWPDNNLIKTLSNFHHPTVLKAGDGL